MSDTASPMTTEVATRSPTARDVQAPTKTITVTGERTARLNFINDVRNLIADLPLNLWRARTEVTSRYRRSIFGPFWLTASTAALVTGYSILAGFLFGRPLEDLIPFIASGVISWQFIAGSINEGTKIYSSNGVEITSSKTNLLNLILRHTIRLFINMLHALPILLAVVFFLIGPNWSNLLLIPALMIFAIASFSASLILASIASRYRDLEQVAAMGTQFMFYMSPIIWDPQPILESDGALFVQSNPFYYFISIFRLPLLGTVPDLHHWAAAGLGAVALFVTACLVHFNLRNKIAFWV